MPHSTSNSIVTALDIQLMACRTVSGNALNEHPASDTELTIGLVGSGQARLTSPSGAYAVPPGSLWMRAPGQVARWTFPGDEPFETIVLRLSGKGCRLLLPDYGLSEDAPVTPARHPLRTRFLLEQIQHHLEDGAESSPLFILTRLLRIAEYQTETRRPPTRAERIVEQVRAIYRNTPQNSVSEIAGILQIGPSTLRKACQEVLQMSAQQYLDRLRQDLAKELLFNSSDKIAYVAACVGFPNEKYFSTWFKKREGLTPSQWRARIGRGQDRD